MREAQEAAIPAILDQEHDVIIAASTASGKTEAAFLPVLTRLAEEPAEPGLAIYIGPLKALINDQWQRLEQVCESLEIPVTPWHGDISTGPKKRFQKTPAGCLLITPESLEAMFMRQGSSTGGMLAKVSYVVIDELHSFIGTERGKQLQSLLCRLELLVGRRVVRIGLSATLGNMEGAKEFLRSDDPRQVILITETSAGQELRVLVKAYLASPPPPIGSEDSDNPREREEQAMAAIADDLYATLRGSNNLVFPNSRRSVEFYADRLRRKCDENKSPNEFWPHHGNLAKEIREETEAALKQKERPATGICTSTLELGIDIGSVKSVAQIGPPPSVASLRQRLGRSGRRRGEPAILRGYVIEEPLKGDSGPHDLLRAGLVQTIAMIRLLTQGWYEPAVVGGLHASTLVQQLLSMLAQRGGARAESLWADLCRRGAFRTLSPDLFSSLLRELGTREIIFQDSTGLLLLATNGERITSHYSFYAAFSSQEEYRIVASGRLLGTMPVERPLAEGDFIIFAGRRWQVESVAMDAREIAVRSAGGGVLPDFNGTQGATLHSRVREEMRNVLRSNESISFLDGQAQILLAEARRQYLELELDHRWLVPSETKHKLFFWLGDRTQDTICLILKARKVAAHNHGLYIEVEGCDESDLHSHFLDILDGPAMESVTLASLSETKMMEKWDPVLPSDLLDASYASARLDLDGALGALRRLSLFET